MGEVLGYLSKNIEFPKGLPAGNDDDPGYRTGQYNNAVDPSQIISGGSNIISDIIGYATGTYQQQAAAAAAQAQAQIEAARAEQIRAAQKKTNWPLILGITGGSVALITGVVLFFKYRRRGK